MSSLYQIYYVHAINLIDYDLTAETGVLLTGAGINRQYHVVVWLIVFITSEPVIVCCDGTKRHTLNIIITQSIQVVHSNAGRPGTTTNGRNPLTYKQPSLSTNIPVKANERYFLLRNILPVSVTSPMDDYNICVGHPTNG